MSQHDRPLGACRTNGIMQNAEDTAVLERRGTITDWDLDGAAGVRYDHDHLRLARAISPGVPHHVEALLFAWFSA